MADDNDVKGPKTKPLRKTSAVPLRKETVRVTLKATPAGASGAPRPPAPAPPKPPSVATTPLETSSDTEDLAFDTTAPITVNSESQLPDVTAAVPLRQETMRVTLKAGTSGAPMAPTPSSPVASAPSGQSTPTVPLTPNANIPAEPAAPTIPLGNTSTPSTPQPAAPAPTIPIASSSVPLGTASSQPLPKATVELQQTQQLGAPLGGAAQMPNLQNQWEEEMDRGVGMLKMLSIAAFVVALLALGAQLMHSKHWLDQHKEGKWSELSNPTPKFKTKKTANDFVKKY